MKKILTILISVLLISAYLRAQVEPGAGKWKTWFIKSGRDYRLPAPSSYKTQIAKVLAAQKNVDSAKMQQINYWNAGAPGYRWLSMVYRLWMSDSTYNGALANMLMGTAIYDATIAAWDTKYSYNRPRPYTADNR